MALLHSHNFWSFAFISENHSSPLWSCDKERRISDNKAFVFMTGSEGDVSGAAERLVTGKEGILLTKLLSI
jgi:hypothetical protein